ncbi:MAG: hypothetical protein LBB06_00675 [Endomicrobium sp.]|jgi:hypothetical protein|nr:hypothetical protein [Endomicrobium sp.]
MNNETVSSTEKKKKRTVVVVRIYDDIKDALKRLTTESIAAYRLSLMRCWQNSYCKNVKNKKIKNYNLRKSVRKMINEINIRKLEKWQRDTFCKRPYG